MLRFQSPAFARTFRYANNCRQFATRRNNQNQVQFFTRREEPLWKQRHVQLWLGVGTFGIATYYIVHLEEVPVSKRRRFMSIDPSEEIEMSRMAYNEVLTKYRTRLVRPSSPTVQMVQRVSRNLIKAAGSSLGDIVDWEVNVIDSPEVNAFVLPNGKIFVFTGIMKAVQSEDALAAVLAHEIAHQMAGHSAEKLSMYKLLLVAQVVMSFFVDVSFIFNPLFLSLGVTLPFSRACEREADYIGLLLMAQACYNPHEAVAFWERMKLVAEGQGADFMSTHPSNDKRISKIQEWMPEAMTKYQAADCQDLGLVADLFRNFRIN